MAEKPQVDAHGVVWANLCFYHDAILDNAVEDRNVVKMMHLRALATGGVMKTLVAKVKGLKK